MTQKFALPAKRNLPSKVKKAMEYVAQRQKATMETVAKVSLKPE
jgi:Tat protein secretion system quality control protein TatD with DNase activity